MSLQKDDWKVTELDLSSVLLRSSKIFKNKVVNGTASEPVHTWEEIAEKEPVKSLRLLLGDRLIGGYGENQDTATVTEGLPQ